MGAVDDSRPALPVRTSRYQRTGRHSSPHQLSLPAEAPALVVAVPGAATTESEEMVNTVLDSASASCPGIPVQAGYLEGGVQRLSDVLGALPRLTGMPSGVVIPLLTGPHPAVDAAIAEAVAQAAAPVLVAGHLGPHPMLAEALHNRLAETGLARAARAGRLSIVAEADGFIVGAVGGEAALQNAGVVAVLLASRLTLPVFTASLTDPASIREGAERLRGAQVARIALAPCVVGPEIERSAIDRVAASAGAVSAPPLGGHPVIGRLVAMRYGAALEDPRLVSQPG